VAAIHRAGLLPVQTVAVAGESEQVAHPKWKWGHKGEFFVEFCGCMGVEWARAARARGGCRELGRFCLNRLVAPSVLPRGSVWGWSRAARARGEGIGGLGGCVFNRLVAPSVLPRGSVWDWPRLRREGGVRRVGEVVFLTAWSHLRCSRAAPFGVGRARRARGGRGLEGWEVVFLTAWSHLRCSRAAMFGIGRACGARGGLRRVGEVVFEPLSRRPSGCSCAAP
jgi:hypothetical protein